MIFSKKDSMSRCLGYRKKVLDMSQEVSALHGGGAFSGKDPSKVDRSGAYMARYIAKNIVGAGLATKCEVQLAYCIGIAEPMSVNVDTYNTGKIDDDKIKILIKQVFDLKPGAIIKKLVTFFVRIKTNTCYFFSFLCI